MIIQESGWQDHLNIAFRKKEFNEFWVMLMIKDINIGNNG